MFGRQVALAGLLGAAVGGPYVMSNAPDEWQNPWGGDPNAAEAALPADPTAALARQPLDLRGPTGPGSNVYESPAALEGPLGMPLEQALNWGVTKNWVYRHWARKSTGLSDPKLFGIRVPLVTGSGMTDIAGSLTYYFDNAGALQRMRLIGKTADTSRLAHLATTRFGMRPVASAAPGEQLLQAFEGKAPRGELRTYPAGVLWATSPHESFDVQMEVTRPGSPYVVQRQGPRLEIPPAAGQPTAQAPETDRLATDGSPILPPRALIPDASAQASNPTAGGNAGTAASTASVQAAPKGPEWPKLGSPTAAPQPNIKPLDGYRPQFRWPN